MIVESIIHIENSFIISPKMNKKYINQNNKCIRKIPSNNTHNFGTI